MTINARIRHKRDTSSNWTANNPTLLNGELIIVDTEAGETRFKIGDGTKTYTQLPFQDEVLRNSLSDTTYTLSKSDNTITLTGSDGNNSSVEVDTLTEEDRVRLENIIPPISFETTLLASGWVDNVYTIENEDILENRLVHLIPSPNITMNQLSAILSANIIGGPQSNGSISLVSLGTVPSIDIPVIFYF